MMESNSAIKSSQDYAAEFLENAAENVDVSFQSIHVLPGDVVTNILTSFKQDIKIGAGIDQVGAEFVCSLCGTLRYRPPATYWIENESKIYIPQIGDQVVGVIEEKLSEFYRVNIFCGASALLSRMAFEGATKRNKPELKRGDLIYARVTLAHKDLDTELTCISASGSKKEWSSGESIYGDLQEGILIKIPALIAKKMLMPDCMVLNVLGKHIPFEIAIGMNGGVWVRAEGIKDTVVIRNALLNAQSLDDVHTEAMVEKLVAMAKR